ncbi:MAG: NUDIX domain-containing protein [Bacteroidales bacterium]|jgi:isopentenyldiphosphate isomerase|nr:NUDIX domain-containing protein [Bacteroidales bacterium]
MKQEEIFPLVDESGAVIGKATRKECHSGSLLLHPVVHLHVFNSAGELYLQKRSMHKDIQPGKWDTSVGGHIDFGEKPEKALMREAHEELGITDFVPQFCYRYVWTSPVERELVNTFRTVYNGSFTPNAEELDGGRFWTFAEIETAMGTNTFTPNFEKEFSMLKEMSAQKK